MDLAQKPERENGAVAGADAAAPYPPAAQGWYCVIVLALVVMINFLDRGILALLVEPIKRDLHLSDVQMSLVMGFAFTFFYAIFGLPVARLIDRGNRKVILAIGIYIFGIMTMATGLATSFWHLFLARMGLGVGETTSGPSAYSLMSDYFPPHRLARAITVMQVGFVAGTGLALVAGAWVIDFVSHHPPVVLPVFGQLYDWQTVLMLIALPGLIVATLMLTVREPVRRGGRNEPAPLGEVFRLIGRHRLIYIPLFIGMGLRSSQMFGTQSWSAAFFSRSHGWSPSQYGYVAGLAAFVAMPVGLFLGNWLTERYWKRGVHDANVRTVVVSTCISVPFGIAFPLMPTPALAVAAMLISQASSMMAAAPENAAVQTVTPNHLRGQVTFLFLFLMNVVGMGLGPIIVAGITQLGFGEAGLGYSLALTGLLTGVPAIIAFTRCLKPYGRVIATGKPVESAG